MKFFLIAMALFYAFSQQAYSQSDGIVCSFSGRSDGPPDLSEVRSHESQIVGYLESSSNDILAHYQLRANYKIGLNQIPADTAMAFTKGGQRFVLFDRNIFRRLLEEEPTTWVARTILAHEIGHLLQGHTVQTTRTPELELEADEFAGGTLFLLGAQLHEAQLAIRKYAAHVPLAGYPLREDRLRALRKGWIDARSREQLISRRNQYVTAIRNVESLIEEGSSLRADYALKRLLPNPGEPDIRSFAWYHYWRRLHSEDCIYYPKREDNYFTEAAMQVLFIPSKGLIATAYANSSVSTGRIEIRSICGPSDTVTKLPITTNVLRASPDGSLLAGRVISGDFNYESWTFGIQLISTTDFSIRELQGGHRAYIDSLAFAPNGRTVTTGAADGTVALWDIESGRHILQEGHADRVSVVVYSPDSRYLFTSAGDGKIIIWKSESLEMHRVVDLGVGNLLDIDFASDSHVAVASTGRVDLYEWDSMLGLLGPLERSFPRAGASAISAIDLHWTKPLLAIGHLGGRLEILSTESGTVLASFEGHVGTVEDVELSESGDLVLTGDSGFSLPFEGPNPIDGATRIFRWRERRPISTEVFGENSIKIASDYQASLVAVVRKNENRVVQIFDAQASLVRELSIATGAISALAFSPDGKVLAVGEGPTVEGPNAPEQSVYLFSVETGTMIARVSGHRQYITDIAFSQRADILVTSSADKLIVWSMAEVLHGRVQKQCEVLHGNWLDYFLAETISLNSDGSAVAAVAFRNPRVQVWDTSTCNLLETYERSSSNGARSIAFSPDGVLLAEGNADWSIIFWSRLKQHDPVISAGSEGIADALAFSPQQRILASGGRRGKEIRLWESGSGLPFGELVNEDLDVQNLQFGDNAEKLIGVGATPMPMRVTWYAASEDEVYDYLRARATERQEDPAVQDNFVRAGWGRYQKMVSLSGPVDARHSLEEALANLNTRKNQGKLGPEGEQWLEELEMVFGEQQ